MINKINLILFEKIVMPIIVCTFIFSCGTAKRSEPIMGKLDIKNESIARGQLVFMKNCQKCHPGGEAGEGPSINNIPLPGLLKRFRIRNKAFLLGLGRMPSFKRNEISKGEMDDLIHYLKAMKNNKKTQSK